MTLLLANGTYQVSTPAVGEPYEPRTWTGRGEIRGLLSEPSSAVEAADGQGAARIVETRTLTCSPPVFDVAPGDRVADGDDVWHVARIDRHAGLGLDHWTIHLHRTVGTAA